LKSVGIEWVKSRKKYIIKKGKLAQLKQQCPRNIIASKKENRKKTPAVQ